jgi:hypothetical protein
VRLLKQSELGFTRSGEGAALESEELGLEERLWNGCAVDLDEAFRGARTEPPDRAREGSFPGSSLSLDEDGRRAALPQPPRAMAQNPPDLLDHRLKRGALSQQAELLPRVHG